MVPDGGAPGRRPRSPTCRIARSIEISSDNDARHDAGAGKKCRGSLSGRELSFEHRSDKFRLYGYRLTAPLRGTAIEIRQFRHLQCVIGVGVLDEDACDARYIS